MSMKPSVDWEKVERDYRAGVLSLREIGADNGCSHVAVSKRAKALNWPRDLNAKIQTKAEALVNKAAVTSSVNSSRAAHDAEVVEANALAITNIRLGHRSDIGRARTLSLSLLAELEVETGDRALFEQLGEMMRNPDDRGMDRLNDAYKKAISLPSRITSAKALADSLKVLVGLEREAYGIAQEPQKIELAGEVDVNANVRLPESIAGVLDSIAGAAKAPSIAPPVPD